jgi:hypothetical protein
VKRLLLALVACGGHLTVPEPHPCSTAVPSQSIASGSISFVAKTAVAVAPPGIGFIVSSSSACADQLATGARDSTYLEVYLKTSAPGTYAVSHLETDANAILERYASSATPTQIWAASGTVTITVLELPKGVNDARKTTPGRLAGTYDLTFPDGAEVKGSLDVPFCFPGDSCR